MATILGFIDPKDKEFMDLKKELTAMYELNKQLTERLNHVLDVLEKINADNNE